MITVPVTCSVFDQGGSPVAGARITAKLDQTEVYLGHVVPELITVTASAAGVAVLNLWPNALGVNGSLYRITAVNPDTGKKFLDTTVSVPNSACNLHQIITAEPYPALDASAQALVAAQGALAAVTAQAGIATTQAGAASSSATGAAASATNAASSATAANNSATAAAASAGSAATSTTAAGAQATAATTKAAESAASAATAATQAGIATTQAALATSNGAAQVALATTQAGLANASANAAAASAVQGAASATSAGTAATSASAAQAGAAASAASATTASTQATASAAASALSATSAGASATNAADQAFVADARAASAASSAAGASNSAASAATQASLATSNGAAQVTLAAAQVALATTQAANAASSAAGATSSATAANGSAGSAATQAGNASTSATSAANSATTATTQAANAAASAASALAIYGTTAVMNAAVATSTTNANAVTAVNTVATTQAAASAASAASANAAKDLAITAWAASTAPAETLAAMSQSLHVGAVVKAIVYDSSRDSDGGQWRRRCQDKSWFTETLGGDRWIGQQATIAAAWTAAGSAVGAVFQASATAGPITIGKYYSANSATTVTEVFRGITREFPAVAGIVAESARVVIYDLTAPGSPMWMVFVGVNTALYVDNNNSTSIGTMNGMLLVGSTSTYGGLKTVNFITEAINSKRNTDGIIHRGFWLGRAISSRNTTSGYDNSSTGNLVGAVVNDIAITVLDNSVLDAATELPVPSIVVGTAGGMSVISNSGVVYNSSNTVAVSKVALAGRKLTTVRSDGTVSVWSDVGAIAAATVPNTTYTASSIPATMGTVSAVA